MFSWCSRMVAENYSKSVQTTVKEYMPSDIIEETKRHRFSALVDGMCIGVGVITIILGILTSMVTEQLAFGLSLIVGGLVILMIGTVVEVHNLGEIR